MKKLILISCFILFCGCNTTKTTNDIAIKEQVRIINKRPYQNFKEYTSVNKTYDTLHLISFENNNEYELSENFIDLHIEKIMFRVSTMEELGTYMIIQNDTLWKGKNLKNAPKYFRIIK